MAKKNPEATGMETEAVQAKKSLNSTQEVALEAPAPAETTPAVPKSSAETVLEQPESPSPKPELEPLAVLVDRHRIPAWQEAALLRFMDWTGDRHVTEQEFTAALDALKARRIGGGRR